MRYYYAKTLVVHEAQPGENLYVFASKACRDDFVLHVPGAYACTSLDAYRDMCNWCDVPLWKLSTDALVHRFALMGGGVDFNPEV